MARILFITTTTAFLVVLFVLEFSSRNNKVSSSSLRRILQSVKEKQALQQALVNRNDFNMATPPDQAQIQDMMNQRHENIGDTIPQQFTGIPGGEETSLWDKQQHKEDQEQLDQLQKQGMDLKHLKTLEEHMDNKQVLAGNFKLNWNLPESTAKWCRPTTQNPLPYEGCDHDGPFNKINFMAGLTNGLKMMLLEVIESFQQGRCFFVTEENNFLLRRDDPRQQLDTFIGRYFEPIGLPLHHPSVKRAKAEGRVKVMNWEDVWEDSEKRRVHGSIHNINSLGMTRIEGTLLKRVMLERMWHLQPHVREESCNSLEQIHGLSDEYLAFSVRRGDKTTEGFEYQKAETYIDPAVKVIEDHFNGKVPKIFVATDDCSIMPEFRELRPDWNFVSECDRSEGHNGFVLREMKDWTLEQTDEHFRKFFVEVIALAGAKYYIGVSYTNVAWWAYYMRNNRWSIMFLDHSTEHAINSW